MINPIDIQNALANDKDMQEGIQQYNKIDEQANNVAKEITKAMVENVMKEENDFNISTAILAVSKSLIQLTSFLYDSEEEFLVAMKHARELTVDTIIPTLVDAQPCGECEECKNGHPDKCIAPKVNTEDTQSRFIPMLCSTVIEYDLFNKVVYMYTAGKNSEQQEEK